MEHDMNGEWICECKPCDGLFSKFSVFRNIYEEHDCGEKIGTKFSVEVVPEERSSFVLIPFNEDGTINDYAAIKALYTYAATTENLELMNGILQWLSRGKVDGFVMNVPHQDSPSITYYG